MNIGLLISELEDKEVKRICMGASQAAREKEVSLIILPGKYLMTDKRKYEIVLADTVKVTVSCNMNYFRGKFLMREYKIIKLAFAVPKMQDPISVCVS